MTDSSSPKRSLRKKPSERRALPRTGVLWTAVVCDTNGADAFDCTVRNINDAGAEVTGKKSLAVGSEVYLLVTRSHSAYLGSVAWVKGERFGLTFRQALEVGPRLAPNLNFLKYLLVQTKLRQMLGLVQRGIPLEEAARILDWTDDEIEQLKDAPIANQSARLVVKQTERLFER